MLIKDIIPYIKRPRKPRKPKHPVDFSQKMTRLLFNALVWFGIAAVYYLCFSFFFDTPVEKGMKNSIETLQTEYDRLSMRYDTVERILNNLVERERNIFRTMFDSDPLVYHETEDRLTRYDSLLRLTNLELSRNLSERLGPFGDSLSIQHMKWESMQVRLEERGQELNNIPSIQPVNNKDLTLIATSFGKKIHPFYKTLVQHNGIDFAVPEGTRVFATADGIVSLIRRGRSNTGVTLVIDHQNGYQTRFHHLQSTSVIPGNRVRRGDIIATSGNTGLSFAPHLHYEVLLDGQPVDPIFYFFHELSPEEFDKARRIASVGMQSFD